MTPAETAALRTVASELSRRAEDMRDQYRRSAARGWNSTWSESCLIQSTRLSALGAFCHALADKYDESEPQAIEVEPGAVYTGPPGPRIADLPPASEVFLESEPASGSEPASPNGPQSVVNTAGRFGATVSGYKK